MELLLIYYGVKIIGSVLGMSICLILVFRILKRHKPIDVRYTIIEEEESKPNAVYLLSERNKEFSKHSR